LKLPAASRRKILEEHRKRRIDQDHHHHGAYESVELSMAMYRRAMYIRQ